MKCKVLVTGATGFLGGAVCHLLAVRGWSVTATGRNETAGHALEQEGITFRRASLEDAQDTAGLCDNQDVVIHCAAKSSPWGRRREFLADNVHATANLLSAATQARVDRFIHVSTPSVYFDFRHRLDIKETSSIAVRSANVYSETKLAAERLVLAAAADGFGVIVLRPRAIFGPGDTAIFPRLLRAARKGRLPIIGDGKNLADLTYIDNAAEAVVCALEAAEHCFGQTFNITDGQPVVLWDFITELICLLGLSAPRRRLSLRTALVLAAITEAASQITGCEPAMTRFSAGVLACSQTFDISKARAMLGYRPVVSTMDGMERLVEHLRAVEMIDV